MWIFDIFKLEAFKEIAGAPVLYSFGLSWKSPLSWAIAFKDENKRRKALIRLFYIDKFFSIFIDAMNRKH